VLYPAFDEQVSYGPTNLEDLDDLSRGDLQKLARDFGIRANQTRVKIIGELRVMVEEDEMEEEEVEKGPYFVRLQPSPKACSVREMMAHLHLRNWTDGTVPVTFPPSSGINVNMMPFIFGDKNSLPPELQGYFDLTMLCSVSNRWVSLCPGGDSPEQSYMRVTSGDSVSASTPFLVSCNTGTICYLTVQESEVKQNACQRRPGAHTEGGASIYPDMHQEAGGTLKVCEHTFTYGYGAEYDSEWGGGKQVDGCLLGGIYLASTVAGSTRVWNARVDDTGLIGPLGDVGDTRLLILVYL
jgi:hypothetical protein